MRVLVLGLILVSSAYAIPDTTTVTRELSTINSAGSVYFGKFIDTEENRVCYTISGGSGGGSSLVCYDRKAKSDKLAEEKSN